jgi:hypothetical protein
MTAPTVSPPQPHLSDEQPVAQYRSIAPLAVVSVGLGIASALILTTPLLAPLPVAGMVVAIAALRSISASGGQLAGRAMAIGGLCLATFFLGFGLSRHLARQAILEQRAHEMADVFLSLLQEGRSKEAHQFRQSPSVRITAPEAIAEHYEKNAEAAKELQGFVTSEGVKELIARGRDVNLQFESVTSATRDGQTDTLLLKYTYQPSTAAAGERKPLWVHINRKWDESTKRHEWEVGGVQTMPPMGAEQ